MQYVHHDIKRKGAFCFSYKGTTPGTLSILSIENSPGVRLTKEKNNHNKQETSQTNLGTP